jgi:hypothetical protein
VALVLGIRSLSRGAGGGIARGALVPGAFVRGAVFLFAGTAIFVFFASAIIVPKVEQYSQGADIDFFIARQGENCYVHTLGFKSYGDLFYTKKERPTNPNSYDQQWLLTGPIDKPVYFVTKVDRVQNWEDPAKYPDLKELYRKNGFVFLKREVPAPGVAVADALKTGP